jgi:hypothetical protein
MRQRRRSSELPHQPLKLTSPPRAGSEKLSFCVFGESGTRMSSRISRQMCGAFWNSAAWNSSRPVLSSTRPNTVSGRQALSRRQPIFREGLSQCSWMFTRPYGMDQFANVRTTMLDDAAWFVPFIETCTNEKIPWATTPAKHSFETFPPMTDYAALVAEYAQQAAKPAR